MSNVALAQAQTLQPQSSESELVRVDRSALNQNVVPVVPMEEPLDPQRYVCSRGDVLELNFWGVQNFKLRVTIDTEGRAFIAKIGYLDLQGKTLAEARRILREEVARYYPRLSFDVTLVELRTFLVHVVETVAKPGAYTAREVDRVSNVISLAGGIAKGGSQRRIEVHRRDGTVLAADLVLYNLTGDRRYNPQLLDGDVVRVPVEGVAATVGGAVPRPGRYELVGSRDTQELLALAGGLGPTASTLLPARLQRRTADDRLDLVPIAWEPGGELHATPLQQEDVLTIPSYFEVQPQILVMGALPGANASDEVSATRRLPYLRGDTVRTLLERAGGVGPLADLTGAFVLRGSEPLPVDLYRLLTLHDPKADRAIELGDALVIPFSRRNVRVEGAVFVPGLYPYNPTFGAEQYLAQAGGANRFARDLSELRLITPSGATRENRPDLKVGPGDTIVVPERAFSRSEVVQIVLSVASVALGGVAVILAARR